MLALHTEANYLQRLTPLFGMAKLGPQMTADIMRRQFIPVLITLQGDPVANIRMNVAKSIAQLIPVASANQASTDIVVSQLSLLPQNCCVLTVCFVLLYVGFIEADLGTADERLGRGRVVFCQLGANWPGSQVSE